MNIAPCQVFRLLAIALTASFWPGMASAQEARSNPLRAASRETRAPAASPASHAERDATTNTSPAATRRAMPAAVRPTGLELVTHPRTGFNPAHGRTTETSMIGSELATIPDESIVEGDIIYEGDMIFDGPVHGGKGGKGSVDCCGGSGCLECCIPCPNLDNFEFFAGVQGFTNPVNRGETGSFGFYEGFNWGAPLICSGGEIGSQFGARTTQSNLSAAAFTDQTQHQLFLTGGLFRRVDWGLQGGLVLDYLYEDWYANFNLLQVRGELSWMFPCVHELGFWFTARSRENEQTFTLADELTPRTETFGSTDVFAFFYRHHFAQVDGAQARFFAGFSADSDGLIGGDLQLPLGYDWALEGGFTYLVPEEAKGPSGSGFVEETWNVAIGFVWYPGARSAFGNDYYRPLFNVADNGSFLLRRP